MTNLLRWLSVIFFVLALLSIGILLIFDVVNHLQFGFIHQRAGALSLMLIGASYISLQLSRKRRWNELLQGILLGTAFLLWGGEQFVPPGQLMTAMDSIVITIFVVDLSLIIAQHLKHKDDETP